MHCLFLGSTCWSVWGSKKDLGLDLHFVSGISLGLGESWGQLNTVTMLSLRTRLTVRIQIRPTRLSNSLKKLIRLTETRSLWVLTTSVPSWSGVHSNLK